MKYQLLLLIPFITITTSGCIQQNKQNSVKKPIDQITANVNQTTARVGTLDNNTWVDIEKVKFSDHLSVRVQKKEDLQQLVLTNNSKDTVIEEAYAFDDMKKDILLGDRGNFRSITFSPSGKYLSYIRTGWESSLGKIYDLEKNATALSVVTPASFGFTMGEKVVYSCASNDMGGIYYGTVYRVPDFIKVFDVDSEKLGGYQEITCSYKSGADTVHFEVKYDYQQTDTPGFDFLKKRILDYNFKTEKVQRQDISL